MDGNMMHIFRNLASYLGLYDMSFNGWVTINFEGTGCRISPSTFPEVVWPPKHQAPGWCETQGSADGTLKSLWISCEYKTYCLNYGLTNSL